MHRWLRTHRAPLGGSAVPAHAADQQRRDSAEYQRAHCEARQLVADYLQEITVTRSAQSELASPSLLPSARIDLARRSAA